ncbi:hypothetical protein DDI_0507 [Dickeya dianthicola RNS04.9]|nr:hypothetical protein DDI_0507 [Dickeya dianthicola RNS04.9]
MVYRLVCLLAGEPFSFGRTYLKRFSGAGRKRGDIPNTQVIS